MGITKRANGYYYLYTQTPAGKRRISLETKDERLAQEIYNAFLLDKLKQKLLKTATDGDFALYLQALWQLMVQQSCTVERCPVGDTTPSVYHIPVASGVTASLPNEIVNLKKSETDFAKGLARIFQTKTKKYKIIYFTDELLALFQSIDRDELFLGCGKQKEYYGKKFRDLKEALNLPKEYCLYAFRHSFGNPFIYPKVN